MHFNNGQEYEQYVNEALALNEPKEELPQLLINAVKKDAKDEIAVLFSGGIDSTVISFILKRLGKKFRCYTTALVEEGAKIPEDLEWSSRVADQLGFDLKVTKISLSTLDKELPYIMRIIHSHDPVKVGVAATVYFSLAAASANGRKTAYSGLTSEEIFGGYERHRQAKDVNAECLLGLRLMYERDLVRDARLGKHFGLRIAMPFLDRRVVRKAMAIPGVKKIKPMEKMPLRNAAVSLGLPQEFAMRKKKAAQYGSKVDWAISKLAKREKLTKFLYLKERFK